MDKAELGLRLSAQVANSDKSTVTDENPSSFARPDSRRRLSHMSVSLGYNQALHFCFALDGLSAKYGRTFSHARNVLLNT